jgi:hygromycin-B 7''-O-kinase
MPLLPLIDDAETFERVRHDHPVWEPALSAIAARHHLRGSVTWPGEGSCVVAFVGAHVIKLFEPWHRAHYDTEVLFLRHVAGLSLPAPTPGCVAVGEIEGWPYVVMGRLAGESMASAALGLATRVTVAREVGAFARALHASPPPPGDFGWSDFVAAQKAGARERHSRLGGLVDLDGLEDLLAAAPDEGPLAPLHTELTDLNVAVHGGHLSGVFDFEPATVGAPHYELSGIAVFIARGDAAVWAAALEGYGVPCTEGLRREVTAWTLLHRYSHLPFFLKQMGRTGPVSLDALIQAVAPI